MKSTKSMKRKKGSKVEVKKEAAPQVVTRSLADNTYSGIIRDGNLGSQFLDCPDAKYTWTSGIKYEGPFVQSRIEGVGKFNWPDGSSYEGELSGGKRHGQGIYIAHDGVTKYEGQWCMGKRHGNGKLTYNAEGTSFYDGGWHDGKKHGFGKQVWPSGNVYEGHWEAGKMQGEGTMTWKVGNSTEAYSGHWEDNKPHGQGSHVWHVAESSSGPGLTSTGGEGCGSPIRQPQQQQQLNRYEGQWVGGQREGVGTFYYANGAYYTGEWKEHQKQGTGRHVNEQGLVYEGGFVADRMEGTHHVPAKVVNLGSEDNPICKTTDITDLEVFSLPSDAGGLEATCGSGYTEPYKIFREIYNLVLRNLGDLREMYNRYRVVAPKAGAEPFALLTYQFWLLARDAGLLTPCCSLARMDRAVFSGPRHHRDTAPDDVGEVRPLTPRPQRQGTRGEGTERTGLSRAGSVASSQMEQGLRGTTPSRPGSQLTHNRPGSSSSLQSGSEGEESMESSLPSPTNGAQHTEFATIAEVDSSAADEEGAGTGTSKPGSAAKPSTAASAAKPSTAASHRSATLRCDTASGVAVDGTVGRKFQRPEGSPGLNNIHNHSGALLFRQFIESFTRCATARFPQERGLESQIMRIYQMLPPTDGIPASEGIFSFLSGSDFQAAMENVGSTLWQLFGSTGREDVDAAASMPAESVQRVVETVPPPAPRSSNSIGLPSRQLHVGARLDVTMRVKDLLKLLGRAGFLRPMGTSMNVASEDATGAEVFTGAAHEDPFFEPPAEGEGEASPEDQDLISPVSPEHESLSVIDEQKVSNAPAAGFLSVLHGTDPELNFLSKPSLIPKGEEEPSRRGRKSSKGDRGEKKEPPPEPEVAPPPAPEPDLPPDLSACDFSLTAIQVLRLIVEVLSPSALSRLQWQIDVMECSQGDERISLLEYLETELIYAEFLRLLVLMADLGTRKQQALKDNLTLMKRFEAFVQSVFLPALETPYAPPVPPQAEAPAEAAEQPAQEAPDDAEPTAEEGAAEEAGEDAEAAEAASAGEQQQQQEEGVLEFWRGFDGEPTALSAPCGRWWPADYDEEVDLWE